MYYVPTICILFPLNDKYIFKLLIINFLPLPSPPPAVGSRFTNVVVFRCSPWRISSQHLSINTCMSRSHHWGSLYALVVCLCVLCVCATADGVRAHCNRWCVCVCARVRCMRRVCVPRPPVDPAALQIPVRAARDHPALVASEGPRRLPDKGTYLCFCLTN